MLTIYISSTYKDLIEERQAVSHGVLALGHHPVAMETYTSSEQRPLDVVRQDIRACDLFIGIYGLRYGFIPEGEEKSITHLEYEEAGNHGKTRLLFIRDEAEWRLENIDEDRTKINAFRSKVLNSHTIRKFKTVGELKSEVLATLGRVAGAGHSPQGVPGMQPIIPYLCDRSDQEIELERAWKEHRRKSSHRPFICVIHGDVQECHDKFVERLRERVLPKYLARSLDAPSIKQYEVEWPLTEAKAAKRLGSLRANLSRKLCNAGFASDAELAAAVVSQNVPVIISVNLYWQSWRADELELIRGWLRFWKGWSASAEGHQLFILICVQYKTSETVWPFEPAGDVNVATSNKIMKDLASLQFWRYELSGVTLELPNVQLGHVDTWAKEYKEALDCPPDEVMQHATRLFGELPAQPGKLPGVPMEYLAPLLRKWAAKVPTERQISP